MLPERFNHIGEFMSSLTEEEQHQLRALLEKKKAKGLSTKTGELGPAVGLSRYPGQPKDFRLLAR